MAATPSTPLPWSYSSLQAFETCPRRYHLTRVAKLVREPQTDATLWGNEVHKALELAVAGRQALAPRHAAWGGLVERLRSAKGQRYTEQKFGLDAATRPCGFMDKSCWVRGVIDLKIVGQKAAVVLDYKTGKVKTDGDQLRLFAAAALAQHPHVSRVHVSYIWLAHDKVTGGVYERDEAPAIWGGFKPRVARLEAAAQTGRWPPNPSGLCRGWCPVGRAHCEFCQDKGERHA